MLRLVILSAFSLAHCTTVHDDNQQVLSEFGPRQVTIEVWLPEQQLYHTIRSDAESLRHIVPENLLLPEDRMLGILDFCSLTNTHTGSQLHLGRMEKASRELDQHGTDVLKLSLDCEVEGIKRMCLRLARQSSYALTNQRSDETDENENPIPSCSARLGGILIKFGDKLDDPLFALETVRIYPEALQHLPLTLRGIEWVVSEAVEFDVASLRHAADELKKCGKFMLKAVKINPEALKYASKDLQNDREFMLGVIDIGPEAVKVVQEILQEPGMLLDASSLGVQKPNDDQAMRDQVYSSCKMSLEGSMDSPRVKIEDDAITLDIEEPDSTVTGSGPNTNDGARTPNAPPSPTTPESSSPLCHFVRFMKRWFSALSESTRGCWNVGSLRGRRRA